MLKKKNATKNPRPTTLVVDIGGSGIKMIVLDASARPVTDRLRRVTPDNPTPPTLLALLDEMKAEMPDFDRVSVGFPGVIKQGRTYTAHNLHPDWAAFPLEKTIQRKWNRPTRLANDAAVQGFAAIKGKGVELVLTLGTGLGSSLFIDGRLCPGLELAHHPWRNGKTYEDLLGKHGLKKMGRQRWSKLIEKAIDQTEFLFNWDHLYLGGGNAPKISLPLPANVSVVSNDDGLLGGVALWNKE
jgi:polyphosphate glucokinase